MRILATLIFKDYITIWIKRFRYQIMRWIIISISHRSLRAILILLSKHLVRISPPLNQRRLTRNNLLISPIPRILRIPPFLAANQRLEMHAFSPVGILNSLLILHKIKQAFLFHSFRIDSLPPAVIRNRGKFEIPRAKTAVLKLLTEDKNIALLILNSLHFAQTFGGWGVFAVPHGDFVGELLRVVPETVLF